MIDLHCHILPNLDDGAQHIDDTLDMAKAALEDGITTIVATPHHQNGIYVNRKEDIITAVKKVNDLLREENIQVEILAGQECRLYGEIIEDFEKGDILPLNESQYLFVEFPSQAVPRYARELFYDIQLKGLQPIIVHPERNQLLMERPEKLYEFVQNGALTQLTAGSVTGKFGKKIKDFTMEIIDANLAHFIATDAHNTGNRGFHLTSAYETISKEYGEELVYLFKENAQLLINKEHVLVEEPQQIQRRKKLFGLF